MSKSKPISPRCIDELDENSVTEFNNGKKISGRKWHVNGTAGLHTEPA